MAAPSGYLTTYPGAYLSEKDFAILMDGLVAPNYSALIAGCRPTVSGSTVTITGGYAIIRGRIVEITGGSLQCRYSESGTVKRYLVAIMKIYTSDADDGTVTFDISDYIYKPYIYDVDLNTPQGHGVNFYGGTAYLPIAELTVTPTNITATRVDALDLDGYIKSTAASSENAAKSYADGLYTSASNHIQSVDDRLDAEIGDVSKDLDNLTIDVESIDTRLTATANKVDSLNVDYLNDLFKSQGTPSGAKTASGNPATLVDNTAERATALIFDFEPKRAASNYMPSAENHVEFIPITQSVVTVAHGNSSRAKTYSYTTDSSEQAIPPVYGGSYNNGSLLAYKYYNSYNGEAISENWLSSDCFKIRTAPSGKPYDGAMVAVEFVDTPAMPLQNVKYSMSIGGFDGLLATQSGRAFTHSDAADLRNGVVALFRYDYKGIDGTNPAWTYVGNINSEPGGINTIYTALWDDKYYYSIVYNIIKEQTSADAGTVLVKANYFSRLEPTTGASVLDLGATDTYELPSAQRVFPDLFQGTNTVTLDYGKIRNIGYVSEMEGTYLIKATIASSGKITYEWVKEE